MFPSLSLIESLELARKMFDKAEVSRRERECGAILLRGNPVSDDDSHITEYIAGYILPKLWKRYPSDFDAQMFVEQLCSFDGAFSSNSLIRVMQNPKFGALIVPVHDLVDVLVYVENVFRARSSVRDCMSQVLKTRNKHYIYEVLYPLDVNEDCILFICRLFVKIGCFQYAKKLAAAHGAQKKQAPSFRKSLAKHS